MDTNGHELKYPGLSSPRSDPQRLCGQGALQADCLTRSREGRRTGSVFSVRWASRGRESAGAARGCRGDFSFQLSPVCSLWHGCHRHGLARIFTDNRRVVLGGVLNHEWTRMDTNGHEWTRIEVARAFQPEICPAVAVHLGNFGGCWSHAKPRSREGKRPGSVFSVRWASRGRESAGAASGCRGDFCFQLSPVYSLWHGCHRHGFTRIFTGNRNRRFEPRMNANVHESK